MGVVRTEKEAKRLLGIFLYKAANARSSGKAFQGLERENFGRVGVFFPGKTDAIPQIAKIVANASSARLSLGMVPRHAAAHRVESRVKLGAKRSAHRHGRISAGETDTFARDPIDVWCFCILSAKTA